MTSTWVQPAPLRNSRDWRGRTGFSVTLLKLLLPQYLLLPTHTSKRHVAVEMGRYRAAAAAAIAVASCASALFIPASSPLVLWQGRTRVNADASVSFDWEGTAATITLQPTTAGAPISWVKLHANVSTARATRFAVISTNGSTSYVTDSFAASSSVSEYLLLAYLQDVLPGHTHRITVWNGMEPTNSGSAPGQDITILGFEVSGDGQFVSTAPLPRRMDVIGDSITAGSQQNREGIICGDWTTTNNQVFNWESYMARNFSANTTTVAWSGRGLTANCGDPTQSEPRLPELYTWTEGGTPGVLWDFSAQSAPDAVLVRGCAAHRHSDVLSLGKPHHHRRCVSCLSSS